MNPKCPACGAGSYKNGFSRSGRRMYKCKSCGKKFNDRAGTPFWHLKKGEKDVLTAALLYVKYPLSTYQVSDLLGLFGGQGLAILGGAVAPTVWPVREENRQALQDQVLKDLARG